MVCVPSKVTFPSKVSSVAVLLVIVLRVGYPVEALYDKAT